jgi:hypothetical protein
MSFGSDKLQPLADRHSYTCRASLPWDAASAVARHPRRIRPDGFVEPCIRCGPHEHVALEMSPLLPTTTSVGSQARRQ